VKKRKAAAPTPEAPEPEIRVERVEDARLAHGSLLGDVTTGDATVGEGDIVGSYSGDKIMDGKIRKPFRWNNADWICVGTGPGLRADAYRVVDPKAFDGTPISYYERGERPWPMGFYHGVAVKFGGRTVVLCGPEVRFVPGGDAIKPPIAGEADPERGAKLEAERATLEYRQKSTKRIDAGRVPIEESPLFGGRAQGNLFGEE
jgi:hypothetical protein